MPSTFKLVKVNSNLSFKNKKLTCNIQNMIKDVKY